MSLVERLEEEARYLDLRKVWGPDGYSQEHADLRDLLLEAAKEVKSLQRCAGYV